MIKVKRKSIIKILLGLYLYISTAVYGWQIVFFIVVYSGVNEPVILERLKELLKWQIYFLTAGFISTTIFSIVLYIIPLFKSQINIKWNKLINHLKMQFVFFLSTFINYFFFLNNIHLNVLELITVAFVIWLIYQLGTIFYFSENKTWFHPTTTSIFFLTSLLQGLSIFLILNVFVFMHEDFLYCILVLLVFDLLVLFARFKYLSMGNFATRIIAKKLLGSYILYFGVRIILGIFMPIVYVMYSLIIQPIGIRGIGILLILSTLIDRFLFLIEGEEQTQNLNVNSS